MNHPYVHALYNPFMVKKKMGWILLLSASFSMKSINSLAFPPRPSQLQALRLLQRRFVAGLRRIDGTSKVIGCLGSGRSCWVLLESGLTAMTAMKSWPIICCKVCTKLGSNMLWAMNDMMIWMESNYLELRLALGWLFETSQNEWDALEQNIVLLTGPPAL